MWYKYLLDRLPALTHSSLGLNHWCGYSSMSVKSPSLKSSPLVSPSLISTLCSPATIVGGTAISTLATALAPTARIISNREFSLININVAFAIATPVAWSVNERCELSVILQYVS